MFGSLIDAVARFRGPRARAALLAGLIPACLAVGGLFPAAAGAATRAFHVYNMSSYSLRYTSTDLYDGATVGTPAVGATLQPGDPALDFEETYYFLSTRYAVANFDILGDPDHPLGLAAFLMRVYGGGSVDSTCSAAIIGEPGEITCTWSGSATDNPGGNTFTLYDPPGTVHDIPAGQGQVQAATLKQLCNDTNQASCNFTPTKREPASSGDHPVGNGLKNNTDEEQETKVTISDTVGSKDSVEIGVDVGAKIFKVVEVSVSAKYGHEWTVEHTFEQDVTVHCPAHRYCWITGDDPMWRDWGDYVLTLGNTTWHLRNIYFDTPNPGGQGAYSVNDRPLTGQELARLPQAVIQTGTDGNDNITGTNVTDRINAKPGNDTVSARAGDDVLSGGSGNDHVQGGPGDDTINGGTGSDSLAGGSGNDRINARDGRADRVDCGGGDDSAAVDSKDRVAGATAQNPNGSCESVARNRP